jgi:hypothetical protein
MIRLPREGMPERTHFIAACAPTFCPPDVAPAMIAIDTLKAKHDHGLSILYSRPGAGTLAGVAHR